MATENSNNDKFTIIVTDDNNRVFDIKKVPVSIPAIEEELAYVGKIVAATTDWKFDFKGYENTYHAECAEWHETFKDNLLIARLDKKQVQMVEYNLDATPELQRYAIVYGIVAHELGCVDVGILLELSKEFQLSILDNDDEIISSDICTAKDILIQNKVRELLVPSEVYTQYRIHHPNATPSEIAAHFKVPEFLLDGM